MVASADGDLYTPQNHNMPEESRSSSEEGSGIRSPIFGVQYATSRGDSNRKSLPPSSVVRQSSSSLVVRYHPKQVKIQNASGILASQFDYNGLSKSMNVQQAPLLDATLDQGSGNHRSNYSPDFPLSSRSHLGLDISFEHAPPPVSYSTWPGLLYFFPIRLVECQWMQATHPLPPLHRRPRDRLPEIAPAQRKNRGKRVQERS